MKFEIIGAGTAGLLAAAVLRNDCVRVVERQPSLPHNHSALLRFRTSIVGDALGIPFTKVNIMKAAVPYVGNPVGDAIAYSIKTSGKATLRSSVKAKGKVEVRWIAPDDLIAQMVEKVTAELQLGKDWNPALVMEGVVRISTIPMPSLMKLLEWETQAEFHHVHGYTVTADVVNCDVCATLYFPDPDFLPYRASITRDRLIVEYTSKPRNPEADMLMALHCFGLSPTDLREYSSKVNEQAYAKILPIDDVERKRFILWATDRHGIYSLGRYATWRPGLLMDDLINDIRVIQRIALVGRYDQMIPRKRSLFND
jgi:hypothetical protein